MLAEQIVGLALHLIEQRPLCSLSLQLEMQSEDYYDLMVHEGSEDAHRLRVKQVIKCRQGVSEGYINIRCVRVLLEILLPLIACQLDSALRNLQAASDVARIHGHLASDKIETLLINDVIQVN